MSQNDRRSFLTKAGTVMAANLTCFAYGRITTDQKPIKVGQIGTQHAHASGKMDTFRKHPEVFDVVGVVETNEARRKQLEGSKTYSGLKWLSEAQLLETPGLQGVAVETDIDNLLPVAERCIAAGQHIHLDKPAGTSLEHFERICDTADKRQLTIQMGYMFRGNPAFRFLFNAVRKGWLGDVFQVHCEMSKKIGDGSRKALARYKGGAMFELGCHLIDAVVTVLGKPDRVSAFNRNTRPDFDNLMDNCLSVFEYPLATASIRSSLSEVDGGRRRQFVVCGTKGSIVIQPLEPHQLTLTLESDTDGLKRGTHNVALPKSAGRYDSELLHFANVVRGIEPQEYDRAHDVVVQRCVLQAGEMFELPLG